MKKVLLTASLAVTLAMGFAATALAQSDAQEEAYESQNQPLAPGSGVTADGSQANPQAMGHSDATNQALDAVSAETSEPTNIENSEALDELNAEGQSVEAGEALQAQ